MKIIFISDTHNRHAKLKLPDGDVLVHAGDATSMGRPEEVERFAKWLAKQPHKRKIFVPGNHDFLFQNEPGVAKAIMAQVPGLDVLVNSGVEIGSVSFWGSPITPQFGDWAFMEPPHFRQSLWNSAPYSDVLVTHSPPLGILDLSARSGENSGCPYLLEHVRHQRTPLHCMAHIHEGRGVCVQEGTTFINPSFMNLSYVPDGYPVAVDYDRDLRRVTICRT